MENLMMVLPTPILQTFLHIPMPAIKTGMIVLMYADAHHMTINQTHRRIYEINARWSRRYYNNQLKGHRQVPCNYKAR